MLTSGGKVNHLSIRELENCVRASLALGHHGVFNTGARRFDAIFPGLFRLTYPALSLK